MDRDAELLDLVCGPASPLPETHQRYRLVQHIATGGQAEVYRAVRLSAGISSAPVTVKVFRRGSSRPRADQLRSWDKGDAVLMDLNSRGVAGICRRADGFYGPPPHPPGAKPKGDPEPYQVLDYLQGINLRDYARQRPGGGDPLDAVGALDTLVRVLLALHHPTQAGASPVVHMDIKPSNVMVLPNGEVRLIDFTGARYHRANHITTIAYTMEAGGPEAFTGTVGTAYDVHGFGAVAYYMVTGAFPRTDSPEHLPAYTPVPPWAVLRRHPVLDAAPALREHLLAPLADRPEDRPGTEELTAWTARLADLVDRADTPDIGMYWGVARSARVVGRAGVRPAPVAAGDGAWHRIERLEQELVELRSALTEPHPAGATPDAARSGRPGGAASAVAGGMAGAAGGLAAADSRSAGAAAGPAGARPGDYADSSAVTARTPRGTDAATQYSPHPANAATQFGPRMGDAPTRAGRPPSDAATQVTPLANDTTARSGSGGPAAHHPGTGAPGSPSAPAAHGGSGARGGPAPAGGNGRNGTRMMPHGQDPHGRPAGPEMRGRATVPQAPRRDDDYTAAEREDRPMRPLPGARIDTLRRGMGISVTCALFAFVCWGIWAIAEHSGFTGKVLMFVLVLAVGAGLFVLCRLLGRVVIENGMHRSRSSARLSHLAVGIYLIASGISFASRVSQIMDAYNWLLNQIT